MELNPKKCQRIRDDGNQCRAPRVTGKDLCAGHLGLGVAGEANERGRAAALATRRHKASLAKKKAIDVYREAVEQHASAFVRRRIQIVKNGSDADALRAMEQLEARALGRPTEVIEQRDQSESHGFSLPELQERVAKLRAFLPARVSESASEQVFVIPDTSQQAGN